MTWVSGDPLTSTNLNTKTPPALTPVVQVSYSLTPVFAANSSGSVIFQLTLTGPVTLPTLTGVVAGQLLTFVLVQDANGGHALTWPTNVVGGALIEGGVPGSTFTQSFRVVGSTATAVDAGTVTLAPADPTDPILPYVWDTTYIAPTGSTIVVGNGGDFQAALNQARPGDVITLNAGSTYTG